MSLTLHLDLQGAPVLVLGGGNRASPWIYSLIDSGALLRVAAPELNFELMALERAKKFRWLRREARAQDFSKTQLLIAASEDSQVNRQALRRAQAQKLWAISADPKLSGSAWQTSSFRRGGLTFHFDLPGGPRRGPLDEELAAYLKRRLSRAFGREWETIWEELRRLKQALPLRKLLPSWLKALRQGRPQKIRRDLEKMLRKPRS